MPSYLTFASTQQYRDALLARNLSPYGVPGVYTPASVSTIVHDTVQTVSSVIDSPDNLIFDDPFADLLYPLNLYGPSNGYDKNVGIRWLTNTRSNAGPYNYFSSKQESSTSLMTTNPTDDLYQLNNNDVSKLYQPYQLTVASNL